MSDELNNMTALQYLKSLPILPLSIETNQGAPHKQPSNSEIKRWLKNKAVLINGQRPAPDDKIELPINELVFFPKGKRKTTML